jgi:hypothetical protein
LAALCAVLVVAASVVWLAPRVTEQPYAGNGVAVGVGPIDPSVFAAGDVVGENLSITVEEDRGLLQEVGFVDRSPEIEIRASFSIPWWKGDLTPEDRRALRWRIDLTPGFHTYRTLEPTDTGAAMGSWQHLDRIASQIEVASWIVIVTNKIDGSTRLWVVLGVDILIAPPVSSQGWSNDDWQQSWRIEYTPGEHAFTWLSSEGLNDANWQMLGWSDIPSEDRTLGGVQLSICRTCDIADGYGDAEEIGRESFAAVGRYGEPLSVEVATRWRPWTYLEPLVIWIIGTLVASVLGLIVSHHFTRSRSMPKNATRAETVRERGNFPSASSRRSG